MRKGKHLTLPVAISWIGTLLQRDMARAVSQPTLCTTSPFARALGALALAVVVALALPAAARAEGDPCSEGNLIPNCGFDSFEGSPPRQVPSGWTPFVLSGDLAFVQDSDTMYAAPSLRMWSSGGTFTAGILTQVGGLQPGATYVAAIGWGGPNAPDTFGRRLGIDPTGGTDPQAPSVVWGPLHYGPGRHLNYPGPYSPGNPNLSVSAVAQAPTMTVFVWVEHPTSTGDNLIFIDNVGLRLDPSAPVATATPTLVPPTDTPEPQAVQQAAQPTATPTAPPTVTPTATMTETPSPTPTATSTPTATPTYTPSPTATPSPTTTPTASPTLRPRPTATPPSLLTQASRTTQRQPTLLLLAGLVSLVGAAGLSGLLWINWRR